MMINKIMLIGNLGRDHEMNYTEAGVARTKFTVAASRRFKDKSGERREETTWFNVVAWDRLGETVNQNLRKGPKGYIEGRMTSHRDTDKNKIERVAWEAVA